MATRNDEDRCGGCNHPRYIHYSVGAPCSWILRVFDAPCDCSGYIRSEQVA